LTSVSVSCNSIESMFMQGKRRPYTSFEHLHGMGRENTANLNLRAEYMTILFKDPVKSFPFFRGGLLR
jgi:hypothetical protein